MPRSFLCLPCGQDMQNAFVLPTNLALAKRTEGEPDRRTEAAIAAAAAAAHAGSVFGLFLLRAASLGALWLAFSLACHLFMPSSFFHCHVHVMRFICVALNASCVRWDAQLFMRLPAYYRNRNRRRQFQAGRHKDMGTDIQTVSRS